MSGVQLSGLIYTMNEVFEILNIISFSFASLFIRLFIIFHSRHLFGEEIQFITEGIHRKILT